MMTQQDRADYERATTWRDLTNHMTFEQVFRFEEREAAALADLAKRLLDEARWEARASDAELTGETIARPPISATFRSIENALAIYPPSDWTDQDARDVLAALAVIKRGRNANRDASRSSDVDQ